MCNIIYIIHSRTQFKITDARKIACARSQVRCTYIDVRYFHNAKYLRRNRQRTHQIYTRAHPSNMPLDAHGLNFCIFYFYLKYMPYFTFLEKYLKECFLLVQINVNLGLVWWWRAVHFSDEIEYTAYTMGIHI